MPPFEQAYADLKRIAHRVRRGRPSETLNTTALVHEAFLKLSGPRSRPWEDDQHFFAVAARAMRQVLVDAARRGTARKRGGPAPGIVTFDDAAHAADVRPEELLALDAALEDLGAVDPRRALVVEHRIFAGLSTVETAALLGISTATVERDWRAARSWLSAQVSGRAPTGVGAA